MCGICGWITKNNKQMSKSTYKKFLQLLVLNESRGSHSCGYAMQTKDEFYIEKQVGPSSAWADAFLTHYRPGIKSMIGHTRFATMGEKNQENAHPFRKGAIIGVHNGIISNHAEIGAFKVDSEAIFEALNIHNNDYVAAFKELRGNIAAAWYDMNRKGSLFLVKESNPIFLAETEDGYFFSSQDDSLELILMGDLVVETKTLTTNHAYEFNVNGSIALKPVTFKTWAAMPVKKDDWKGKKNENTGGPGRRPYGHDISDARWEDYLKDKYGEDDFYPPVPNLHLGYPAPKIEDEELEVIDTEGHEDMTGLTNLTDEEVDDIAASFRDDGSVTALSDIIPFVERESKGMAQFYIFDEELELLRVELNFGTKLCGYCNKGFSKGFYYYIDKSYCCEACVKYKIEELMPVYGSIGDTLAEINSKVIHPTVLPLRSLKETKKPDDVPVGAVKLYTEGNR